MKAFVNASRQHDEVRRAFIKKAGAFTAILLTSGLHGWTVAAQKQDKTYPLHPGLLLPGIHGYPDQESVEAGKTIRLHISANIPYDVELCRLGNVPDDPAADEVLARFANQKPFPQAIYPGSYVYVDTGIKGTFEHLTVEGWTRPWKTDAVQAIFAQEDFQVRLNADAGFDIGAGATVYATATQLVQKNKWYHWAVVVSGRNVTFYLNGKAAGEWKLQSGIRFAGKAITFGAGIANNTLQHFADADIAAIGCYASALSAQQVQKRFAATGLEVPQGKHVLAYWPFSEEQGNKVADASGHRLNGTIINHATWMIGGPSFSGEVERFKPYDPRKDTRRGHGLRLASDDLYDCAWKETLRYKIPLDAKPGFYVARIRYVAADGKNAFYDIAFIVRKPASAKKAPILVLAATNTWRAYNATPFGLHPTTGKYNLGTEGLAENPLNPPAYSFYRAHAAGQGTYQVGLKIPWPAAGPYVLYGSDYSHLLRADRFTHLWLDREGYQYDVITDTDLHRNPSILQDYQVFVINGHSEYWSVPMYKGLEAYLNRGGKTVVLSGNTMFWRVSFDDQTSVMECRKVDSLGFQLPADKRGEAWHSHDKEKGGLLRETAYPGWKVSGLEMLGWINSGIDEQYGPYVVRNAEHFLFNTPYKTGLKNGETFALSGEKFPGANGHEIDVRLSTLRRLQEQPDLSLFPEEPAGITTLASGKIPWKLKGREHIYSGESFDIYMRTLKKEHDQGADLIYWERPYGGKVFNTGAIRSGWALWADQKFSLLVKNVLHHFGVAHAGAQQS